MCKKLVCLFLFIYLSLIFGLHTVKSQQILDTIYVSKNVNNIPLTALLTEFETTFGVKFYYKKEWFEGERITYNFAQMPLGKAIVKMLGNKPYTFSIFQDNMVVFLPKEKVALIMGDMLNMTNTSGVSNVITIGKTDDIGKYKQVELKGIVRDGKTGDVLIGATLQIENTTQGVTSDVNGSYNFKFKPGIYNLVVSSIGFEKAHYQIKVVGPGFLDIELFEKSLKIGEVSVYAQRADENVKSSQMSLIELDARSIKLMPAIVGEKDLMKNLTMMPGVKSVGEFGSGINVRGGGEDQNLYLLEGAPIFNTSHVFGLISVINPDAVNSMTLYKGHIPASMGERVSSVLDVQIRDNNGKKLQARGGIGLFNSRLLFEGPLIKDKVTFKIGGRSSYSDFLLNTTKDYYLQNSTASFYDVNALLNFNLKNNRISIFAYKSADRFKYADNMDYNYGNLLGSMNWNHTFNTLFNADFLVSYSKYNVTREDLQPEFKQKTISSYIEYLSGKLNFTYSGITNNKMDFGLQAISYGINPGERNPAGEESLIPAQVLKNEQGIEAAAYINDIYDINNNITINGGIRLSNYMYLGPYTSRNYLTGQPVSSATVLDTVQYASGDVIESTVGIEPRLSFKFQLTESSSVKLSYNRNNQYISLISYSAVPTPDDIWKLSDQYLKPMKSDQMALGYYRNFNNNIIETSIEVYYKNMHNVIDYKNNAVLEMNQFKETELVNTKGKNYGAELFVKKREGKLTGWMSYTYSRAFRQTLSPFVENQINRNEWYPSSYDKPHSLTLMANYNFNLRWRFGANFNLSSGRSITLPEYQFRSGNELLVYYSDRNKYRLPYYHRLDISISVDESLRIKKKWKGSWTLSILNIYARKNAYSVFYKKEIPDITNDYRRHSLYKLYIIGKPIPTLTYNFIF